MELADRSGSGPTSSHPACCTGSFIKKEEKITKYSASILWWHYQLRHLCALSRPHSLYFVEDLRFIFNLNTKTKIRKFICKLPFKASCLAAKDDWVCVGCADENAGGRFIVIKINESGYRNDGAGFSDVSPPHHIRAEEEGTDVINSITIWKPEGAVDDSGTVAILTNNDKTVRIYLLEQGEFVTTLEVGLATNHASISPDGTRLIAVTDTPDEPREPTLYFYRAIGEIGSPRLPHLPPAIPEAHAHDWLKDGPGLFLPGDSLFSSGFSASGEFCAVANQGLSISIYRMKGVDGPPEEFAVIPSSQSHRARGAIRSLIFSPRPWDLLIWAEGTGRIGIADQRTGFKTHQIIDLEDLQTEDAPTVYESQDSDSDHMDTSDTLFIQQRPQPSRRTRSALPPSELMNETIQSLPSLSRQLNAVELDHQQTRAIQPPLLPLPAGIRTSTRFPPSQPLTSGPHSSPLDPPSRVHPMLNASNLSVPHLPSLRQRASDNFRSQILDDVAANAAARLGTPPTANPRSARPTSDLTGQVQARSVQQPIAAAEQYSEIMRAERLAEHRERAIRSRAAASLVSAGGQSASPGPRSVPPLGVFPPLANDNSSDEENFEADEEEESTQDGHTLSRPSDNERSSAPSINVGEYLRLRRQITAEDTLANTEQLAHHRPRRNYRDASDPSAGLRPTRHYPLHPPSGSSNRNERVLPLTPRSTRAPRPDPLPDSERRWRGDLMQSNDRAAPGALSIGGAGVPYYLNNGRSMEHERNTNGHHEPLSNYDVVGLCMEEDGSIL